MAGTLLTIVLAITSLLPSTRAVIPAAKKIIEASAETASSFNQDSYVDFESVFQERTSESLQIPTTIESLQGSWVGRCWERIIPNIENMTATCVSRTDAPTMFDYNITYSGHKYFWATSKAISDHRGKRTSIPVPYNESGTLTGELEPFKKAACITAVAGKGRPFKMQVHVYHEGGDKYSYFETGLELMKPHIHSADTCPDVKHPKLTCNEHGWNYYCTANLVLP
ncbi:hypothetical protein CEUSTIGMA_g12848.t1 [Chlamydomonas eustigma]|uniref:Uncharacterized protein n=1 Tax=Chlamydomonas eustigma TaxID=1157962 RepID=A0A250XR63_9CHLO|nr:hypothetical protein CEUSTIGMA_g12848.t1 [Chlamydomonas eustigma]|eukprot:GAX85432.1 hypothetical protein CEUSTIGMA_g12848.t1 [Chlamydomonas eustigma]